MSKRSIQLFLIGMAFTLSCYTIFIDYFLSYFFNYWKIDYYQNWIILIIPIILGLMVSIFLWFKKGSYSISFMLGVLFGSGLVPTIAFIIIEIFS